MRDVCSADRTSLPSWCKIKPASGQGMLQIKSKIKPCFICFTQAWQFCTITAAVAQVPFVTGVSFFRRLGCMLKLSAVSCPFCMIS